MAAQDPTTGGGDYGGGDYGGADDPMGAALDDSAAQSDASGTPADGGQEAPDTFGEVAQDDGTPKEEEDDQSGSVAG